MTKSDLARYAELDRTAATAASGPEGDDRMPW
jgi:hypothetical protein